jgi:dethiobiotin synthetase
MKSIVVTGTDTGIGKTVFSAGLAGFLGARYWKPVQSGLDGPTDSEIVAELAGVPILPEGYRLTHPLSPHQSAADDGVLIDTDNLNPPDDGSDNSPLVIEGAGGLMVPLTTDTLFIDVFARWHLPLVLVARTTLGTINHTLLSVAAIRARGIPLLGVAFVGEAFEESERIITKMGQVKRLGRLPPIAPLVPGRLAGVFSKSFHAEDFSEGVAGGPA